jgi:hypothetical protein
MNRSRVVLVVGLLVVFEPLHPIAANQAVDVFRVSTSALADAQLDSLQTINPESKQPTEVFPGTYASPFGAEVIQRIEELSSRLDQTDRDALIASKAAAGFDRSIMSWRAHPAGRRVALAVRYSRERLLPLKLQVTDDYGRADPVNPARYELFTIAVCSRTAAEAWACGEELLTEAASRYNVTLPPNRAEWKAAAEKVVEIVAGK